MSDENNEATDLKYILTIVGLGIAVVGLLVGIVAMFVNQRNKAAKLKKLDGITDYIDKTYGQPGAEMGLGEENAMKKLQDVVNAAIQEAVRTGAV